jgi:hypothetical protein
MPRAADQGAAIFDRDGTQYPERWEALTFLLAQSELALAQGDVAQAAACTAHLLEKYDAQRLRHLLPGFRFFRARIALAQGNHSEARLDLLQALAQSDELGAHRVVWAMCAALGELEAAPGNLVAAAQLRARACTEEIFIATHAGTPELRATFLARPDMRQFVAAGG